MDSKRAVSASVSWAHHVPQVSVLYGPNLIYNKNNATHLSRCLGPVARAVLSAACHGCAVVVHRLGHAAQPWWEECVGMDMCMGVIQGWR